MRGNLFILSLFISISGCKHTHTLPGKLSKPQKCAIPYELTSNTSKITIIGVFTTWSLKSQIQLQRFRKVASLLNTKRVSFYIVLTDPDQKIVEDWIEAYKPVFPVLYDPKFTLCSRLISKVPTVIIYKKGKIYYYYSALAETKILYKQIVDVLGN